MRIPDSYLDYGNPWTEDREECCYCGSVTTAYAWIANEPVCEDCEDYDED